MLAAVLVSALERGRAGARALFRPLRTWRVGAMWYVIALCLHGAIFITAMALYTSVSGSDAGPWFYPPADSQRIVAMLVFSIGEEVGWRGFALPRLQRRYGSLNASLTIGVLWAFWHIPMFMLAGISLSLMPLMVLFLTAASVVFTWIYNHTRGSLLLAVLAHMGAHLNNSHQALPANVTPVIIHTVAYVIVAMGLIFGDRRVWRARYSLSSTITPAQR